MKEKVINRLNQTRVLILYHSGSGSTKRVGEFLRDILSTDLEVHIESISNVSYDYSKLDGYDSIVLGYPTYHTDASPCMWKFLKKMPQTDTVPVFFLYTTCAMYSGNANRHVAKYLNSRGFIVGDSKVFFGPASDGAVMFPYLPKIFRHYHKSTTRHLMTLAESVITMQDGGSVRNRLPLFKWYTPLNYPNELGGKYNSHRLTKKLHIDSKSCMRCNKCITMCINGCYSKTDGIPEFDPADCGFCLKCVHHCPAKAIVFSNKMKERLRLDDQFYEALKLH